MNNAMWTLKGKIDPAEFPAAPAGEVEVREDNGACRWQFAGVDIAWRPEWASHASRDGVLVLVLGRPRAKADWRLGAAEWLNLYHRHGEAAPLHVGGAFAAIVVDLRKRTVMLHTDRFAAQTLCYASEGSTLQVSDRAMEVPVARKSVDPQALYDYLYFHVIPAPGTVFREVHRLDAGMTLVANAEGSALKRWWTPGFVENDRSNLQGRLRQFLDLVDASVREEIDDPATACFLSGGTDSSTVAGMLTRARGAGAECYSIGFEAEGYDEMEYARIAARHFKLKHHEYYVTPQDLLDAIPKVSTAFDQPFGNSSVLPTYYCALQARGDGHTRMLAGDGGDELFGGNSRYATQQLFDFYQYLPEKLRASVLEPVAKGWPIFRSIPGLRQMGGYVRHASVPMPDRMETFNLLHRFKPGEFFQQRFWESIDSRNPLEHQRKTYREVFAPSLLNRMLAYDWKYTLADSDLPKVRGATRLAGVSVGFPLLSRELTDFSLGLPPDWKLRHGVLRWFFKKALTEFLPREIIKKKKHGFGLPFGPWALRTPKLHAMAREALEGSVSRGILNQGMARQLMQDRLPEAPGYYGEVIWILMTMEYWLAAHAPDFSCR